MKSLSIGKGNAKLSKSTLTFSLPAGRTCPGARDCKAWVSAGKIVDGPHTTFRCFAASNEVMYPNVHRSRAANLSTIAEAVNESITVAYQVLADNIQPKITKSIDKFRIHPSGDFFAATYLAAWLSVAARFPNIKFYAYTKSLYMFIHEDKLIDLPSNFYITASAGGEYSHLEHLFPRVAYVVNTEEEAAELGLEIDHDDSHCFGDKSFALLVHGTQPKGSIAGAAIRERRRQGKHAGYSK